MSTTALLVTPNFPPATGGIEALLYGAVTRFSTIETVVVALDSPGADEFDSEQALRVVRVSRTGGQRLAVARLNAAAVRLGTRGRPSVVLSGHIVTSPSGWALSRLTDAPFVQYLYGRELARRPRLARFATARAAASVAISAYTEELAGTLARTRPLHRIPPGVSAPVTSAPPERRLEIVTVARLVERSKGHDVLIGAMPSVLARVPTARLSIVGDGPLRNELEELAATTGVRESVDFHGSVDDRTRDELLSRAAVFALPTRLDDDGGGEGFGIVYLEAAAHGLPVVAGDAGGAPDAVVDDQTGLLVDATDSERVAAALVRLLLDPALRARLGRGGAARASSFAWDVVAPKLEQLLLAVAGGS
jgi:phosphatidylinositol alpha-1,6-mannosyltransferase